MGFVTSSMGGFPDGPGLEGTAPQVVAGQPYPGRLLQDEVSRVLGAGFGGGFCGAVTSVACPATPAVVAGAVTLCQGVVDGSSWSYRVTFEDGMGHFTLDEKVD